MRGIGVCDVGVRFTLVGICCDTLWSYRMRMCVCGLFGCWMQVLPALCHGWN